MMFIYLYCSLPLTDTDPSQDWTVRHGRAVALYIALKEAPDRVIQSDLKDKIMKAIHVYTTADRVSYIWSFCVV